MLNDVVPNTDGVLSTTIDTCLEMAWRYPLLDVCLIVLILLPLVSACASLFGDFGAPRWP